MWPHLNERSRRMLAGAEALQLAIRGSVFGQSRLWVVARYVRSPRALKSWGTLPSQKVASAVREEDADDCRIWIRAWQTRWSRWLNL